MLKMSVRNGVAGVLALALCVAACDRAATTPESVVAPVKVAGASVEHGATAPEHRLSWTLSDPAATVDIEVMQEPDAAPGAGVKIADDLAATAFTWTSPTPARNYFIITPEGGEPVRTAARVLPLEGGRNFRDLGGYPVADGKTVKWGQLYRSGVMSELTQADYAYLSGLDIKMVCDLRTEEERTLEPTTWSGSPVDYVTFPDPAENGNPMGFMAVLREPGATPDKVADAMARGYAQIARDQAPAYRVMFDRLAANETPLAFNCSAGKDRTGIGAALILTALGVPRETVLADYAMSDKIVDYMAEFVGDEGAAADAGPYAFLRQLPPEMVAPLMKSDPRYLETVLAAMEASHGGVLAYIQTELEVTDEELAAIRGRLLH